MYRSPYFTFSSFSKGRGGKNGKKENPNHLFPGLAQNSFVGDIPIISSPDYFIKNNVSDALFIASP